MYCALKKGWLHRYLPLILLGGLSSGIFANEVALGEDCDCSGTIATTTIESEVETVAQKEPVFWVPLPLPPSLQATLQTKTKETLPTFNVERPEESPKETPKEIAIPPQKQILPVANKIVTKTRPQTVKSPVEKKTKTIITKKPLPKNTITHNTITEDSKKTTKAVTKESISITKKTTLTSAPPKAITQDTPLPTPQEVVTNFPPTTQLKASVFPTQKETSKSLPESPDNSQSAPPESIAASEKNLSSSLIDETPNRPNTQKSEIQTPPRDDVDKPAESVPVVAAKLTEQNTGQIQNSTKIATPTTKQVSYQTTQIAPTERASSIALSAQTRLTGQKQIPKKLQVYSLQGSLFGGRGGGGDMGDLWYIPLLFAIAYYVYSKFQNRLMCPNCKSYTSFPGSLKKDYTQLAIDFNRKPKPRVVFKSRPIH